MLQYSAFFHLIQMFGHWVLLDDINCALPEVIERLNSLLEDEPTLHLFEKGEGEELSRGRGIHPDFRLFATADLTRVQTGNAKLSPALLNRMLRISLPALHIPPAKPASTTAASENVPGSTAPNGSLQARTDLGSGNGAMQLLLTHFQDVPGGVEMAAVCGTFHAHVVGMAEPGHVTFRRLQSALRLQGCLQRQGVSPVRALVSALISTYLQVLPDTSEHANLVEALRDLLVKHASMPSQRAGDAGGDMLPRAPRLQPAGRAPWESEATVLCNMLIQLHNVLLRVGASALGGLRRQSYEAWQIEECSLQYFELFAQQGKDKPGVDDLMKQCVKDAVGDSEGMSRLLQKLQLPIAHVSTAKLLSNVSQQCDKLDAQLQTFLWSASFDDLPRRLQLLRHIEHTLQGHLRLLWNPVFSAPAEACSPEVAEFCAEAGARVSRLLWCSNLHPALSMLQDSAIAKLHQRLLAAVAGPGSQHGAARWTLQMELRKPFVEAAESLPRVLRQLSARAHSQGRNEEHVALHHFGAALQAAMVLWEGTLRLPHHISITSGTSSQQTIIAGVLTASTAHAMDVAGCAKRALQNVQGLMARLNECIAQLQTDQSALAAGKETDGRCCVDQALQAARELVRSSDMGMLRQVVVHAEVLSNEAAGNALLSWLLERAPSDGSPVDPPEAHIAVAMDTDFARVLQSMSRVQLQHPLANLWAGLFLSPVLCSVAQRISRLRFFSTASLRAPGALPSALLPGRLELWALYDRELEGKTAYRRPYLSLLLLERERAGFPVTVTAYVCMAAGEGAGGQHRTWCSTVPRGCMADCTDRIEMQYCERRLPVNTSDFDSNPHYTSNMSTAAVNEALVRACFSALVDYEQQKQQKPVRFPNLSCASSSSSSPRAAWGPRETANDAIRAHSELLQAHASSEIAKEPPAMIRVAGIVLQLVEDATQDLERMSQMMSEGREEVSNVCKTAWLSVTSNIHAPRLMIQLDGEMDAALRALRPRSAAAAMEVHRHASQLHVGMPASTFLEKALHQADAVLPFSAAQVVLAQQEALRVLLRAIRLVTALAMQQGLLWLKAEEVDASLASMRNMHAALARSIDVQEHAAQQAVDVRLTEGDPDISQRLRHYRSEMTRVLKLVMPSNCSTHLQDVTDNIRAAFDAALGRMEALLHQEPLRAPRDENESSAPVDVKLTPAASEMDEDYLRMKASRRQLQAIESRLRALLEECRSMHPIPHPVINAVRELLVAVHRPMELASDNPGEVNELSVRQAQLREARVRQALREYKQHTQDPDLLRTLLREKSPECEQAALLTVEVSECMWAQQHPASAQGPAGITADCGDGFRALLPKNPPGMPEIRSRMGALKAAVMPTIAGAGAGCSSGSTRASSLRLCAELLSESLALGTWDALLARLEQIALQKSMPADDSRPGLAAAQAWAQAQELCAVLSDDLAGKLLAAEPVRAGGSDAGEQARMVLPAVLHEYSAARLTLLAKNPERVGDHSLGAQVCQAACIDPHTPPSTLSLCAAVEEVGAWQHILRARLQGGLKGVPCALEPPLLTMADVIALTFPTMQSQILRLRGMDEAALHAAGGARPALGSKASGDPEAGGLGLYFTLHVHGRSFSVLDCESAAAAAQGSLHSMAAHDGTPAMHGVLPHGLRADSWPQHQAATALCLLYVLDCACRELPTSVDRVLRSSIHLSDAQQQRHEVHVRQVELEIERRTKCSWGMQQPEHYECGMLIIDELQHKHNTAVCDMQAHVSEDLRHIVSVSVNLAAQLKLASIADTHLRTQQCDGLPISMKSPDSLGQDLCMALTDRLMNGTDAPAACSPKVWLCKVQELEEALRKLDPKHAFVQALSRVCQLARIGLHAFHNSMQAALQPALGHMVRAVQTAGTQLSEALFSLGEAAGPLGEHLESMVAASIASSPAKVVLAAGDRVVELLGTLAEERRQIIRLGLGNVATVLDTSLQRLEGFSARCVLAAGRHTARQQGAAGLFEAHEERLLQHNSALPPLCDDEMELHQLLKAFRLLSGMMAHSLRELPELLLRGYNGNPAHLQDQVSSELERLSSYFLPASYVLRLLVGGIHTLVDSVPIERGALTDTSASQSSDTAHMMAIRHSTSTASGMAPLSWPTAAERCAIMCILGALESFGQCPANVQLSSANREDCASAVDNLRARVKDLSLQLLAHRVPTRGSKGGASGLGGMVGHRLGTLAQLLAKHFLEALCGIAIAAATPSDPHGFTCVINERGAAMQESSADEPHDDADLQPQEMNDARLYVKDFLIRPRAARRFLADASRDLPMEGSSTEPRGDVGTTFTGDELSFVARLLQTGMHDVSTLVTTLYVACPGQEVISVRDGLQLCQAYVDKVKVVISVQATQEEALTAALRGALDSLCGSEGDVLNKARMNLGATFLAALTEGCNQVDQAKHSLQVPSAPTKERWLAHCDGLCKARAECRVSFIANFFKGKKARVRDMVDDMKKKRAAYDEESQKHRGSIEDAEAALKNFFDSTWQHAAALGSPEQGIFDPVYVRCMLDVAQMRNSLDSKLPPSLGERFSCSRLHIPEPSTDETRPQVYCIDVYSNTGMECGEIVHKHGFRFQQLTAQRMHADLQQLRKCLDDITPKPQPPLEMGVGQTDQDVVKEEKHHRTSAEKAYSNDINYWDKQNADSGPVGAMFAALRELQDVTDEILDACHVLHKKTLQEDTRTGPALEPYELKRLLLLAQGLARYWNVLQQASEGLAVFLTGAPSQYHTTLTEHNLNDAPIEKLRTSDMMTDLRHGAHLLSHLQSMLPVVAVALHRAISGTQLHDALLVSSDEGALAVMDDSDAAVSGSHGDPLMHVLDALLDVGQ
eukprot:gene1995-2680_t